MWNSTGSKIMGSRISFCSEWMNEQTVVLEKSCTHAKWEKGLVHNRVPERWMSIVPECFFRDNHKRQWEGVMKQPHTQNVWCSETCAQHCSLTPLFIRLASLSSAWRNKRRARRRCPLLELLLELSASVGVALSCTSRRGGAVIWHWHLGCAGLPCGV